MRQRLVRVLLSAAMLIGGAFPASVLAQGLTGQISGTVTDAGGGVMPGATVSIKNAGTNQVRETVTGAEGAFAFPDLLAGTYDISVSVQGFKTYEQKGINLGATSAWPSEPSHSRSASCRRRSPYTPRRRWCRPPTRRVPPWSTAQTD